MSFTLEKAIFINRAPFEHLELYFRDKGVNVLSAINGKGKTTILSHIADAFYELAKIHYKYLQPIITQYFIDNKSEIWLLFLIAHSKR